MNKAHAAVIGGILGIGLFAGVAMSNIPSGESETPLPACATEDSDNCYWDADTQGNEQGTDSVVITPTEAPIDPPIEIPLDESGYPTEGMPEDFDPETDSTAPIEGPYEGQWDEDPGEGYLLCGPDAAPATDYNPVWGYWAYCEPALVNEDGTLWEGR
jgi:hypothetical protein